MRKEIANWWEQAEEDLKNAGMNLKNGAFYVCVFLCQQSIEKGLKAYFMIRKKESPGTTHSLIYLSKATGVPAKHIDFLAKLTPEFVATRYPDVADDIPARIYTEKTAEEIFYETEEFMKWLRDQMKRQ